MYIVNHRGLFFTITGILLAIALGAIAIFGLPFSIDFTGGSLVEVSYTQTRPDLATIKQNVNQLALGETSLRESGTNGVILRTRTLTPAEHTEVLAALGQGTSGAMSTTTTKATSTASTTAAGLTELRFNSIGPSLGSELAIKALYALAAVIIAIMLYIAWAFRRVSKPVSGWVYGAIVVVILFHDVIIPAGFYAILCHFTGSQVDSLFVVALLAILGYSVNDTIVIFDRVREHLHNNEHAKISEPFAETVGKSITETLGRSINTSLTVVLALLALVFIGSKDTVDFALVLLVGVVAGTYSSILLAAPLLVPLAERFAKSPEGKKKK
ncbi:MAG: Protein-export rane protein SecF [Parcubacteria group bacterium]|nr:Protein-export rane protein SecF [Parcubacteria group bacterium]